jgi:hypothetical protein
MKLSPSTRSAVEAWIADALPRLGLGQWEITVAEDAAAEDAWADIEPHSIDPRATMRIGAGLEGQTPERQRQVLTHELVHLFLHPLDRYTASIEGTHGSVWYGAWYPGYDDHLEQATERIAKSIAPHLPMPHLNGKGGKVK